MDEKNIQFLLNQLIALPTEQEWVEFKCNNDNPDEIGEYISALSNTAALHKKEMGYIVWGIDDKTHLPIGTKFKPITKKKGNENLESWLSHLLEPRLDFRFCEFKYGDVRIVLLEIPATTSIPVSFKGTEYIRVGTYKKKLKNFPEKERILWSIFRKEIFESGLAMRSLTVEKVLELLDYSSFFKSIEMNLPNNLGGKVERMVIEGLVVKTEHDEYAITNLGAVLYAHRLDTFESLSRKSIRVIQYKGSNRVDTLKEQLGTRGYASGFEGLLKYINGILPSNEEIGQALRKQVRVYPEIAVRELVANALIHQDFTISGAGPTIEIFPDRIEITNPGIPLIDTLRFIDEPPISRNEKLARMMRRLGICEERGSGIDKVVFQAELYQLPAPDFTVTSNHTKAILYAPKKLNSMSASDKIRACYQHACLCFVSNNKMTNMSLRKRFGIEEKNYSIASRIIAETLKMELIKPADPKSRSKKWANYLPFWA